MALRIPSMTPGHIFFHENIEKTLRRAWQRFANSRPWTPLWDGVPIVQRSATASSSSFSPRQSCLWTAWFFFYQQTYLLFCLQTFRPCIHNVWIIHWDTNDCVYALFFNLVSKVHVAGHMLLWTNTCISSLDRSASITGVQYRREIKIHEGSSTPARVESNHKLCVRREWSDDKTSAKP